VEIDLIVRGKCALRPGIRGVSDRIRVRSIVGRFLEHSRIFYFANAGDDEIYVGSADLMPRNLYDRVEVVFPIRDAMQRQRVLDEILRVYLSDTVKTRLLQSDGSYVRAEELLAARRSKQAAGLGPAGFNAQEFLIGLAEGKEVLQETRTAPRRRLSRKPRR
jgi:polyphosphate kinase